MAIIKNASGGDTIIPTTPTNVPSGIDPTSYANFQKANPGLNFTSQDLQHYQSAGQTPFTSPSPSVDVSAMTGATPFTLPPAPTTPNYDISSLPSIASLLNPTPTAAQNKQDTLESQLETDTAKLGTKTAAQTTAEDTAARALGATTGLSDFNTQLTDINNQVQTLAKENAAIPLQLQENATGRGITTTALNTQQTGLIRQNTIKALGLSAIAQTLQGNIASAQATATRAVDLQFAPVQAEIDYLKQALEDNKDNLDREDKQRANQLQVALQDRQAQLDQQKDDRNTVIAMASAAMKNNPNDPAAQYAAQQALQAPDLATAFQLVGKYQTDLVQQALDAKLKNAQIESAYASAAASRASAAKTNAEAQQITGQSGTTAETYNARQDTINLVNTILGDKNMKFAFGGYTLDPFTYIPGNASQPVKNQVAQLIAQLSLDNRSKLKGSGAVSDFESKTLADASTALNTSLNPDDAAVQLKQIRGVLTTLNGGAAVVTVTDPATGESATAQADRDAINKMISDGKVVKYQ